MQTIKCGPAIAACLLAALVVGTAQGQDQPRAPLRPPSVPPESIEPLPPLSAVAEDVQNLKQQVDDLQAELAEMKTAAGAAAGAKPAAKKNPEEEQTAFNKLFDKARGRYPNVAINGVFQSDAGFFHQDTIN